MITSSVDIEVNGQPLTVRKIPLRKYAELVPAFKNLSQYSSLFGDLSTEKIMEALPTVLMQAPDSVEQIVGIITGASTDSMKEWGLDDYVKVFEALFQVNDFAYVYQTLKKGMTRLNIQKQPGIAIPASPVPPVSQTAPLNGVENPFQT